MKHRAFSRNAIKLKPSSIWTFVWRSPAAACQVGKTEKISGLYQQQPKYTASITACYRLNWDFYSYFSQFLVDGIWGSIIINIELSPTSWMNSSLTLLISDTMWLCVAAATKDTPVYPHLHCEMNSALTHHHVKKFRYIHMWSFTNSCHQKTVS